MESSCCVKDSSQNAGQGPGSGCLFCSNFVCFNFCPFSTVMLYSNVRHLSSFRVEISKKKYGTYGSYERDIFVCFSKLREFQTELGVFVGNIR